jgi:glycosyltransferase involved in cell wall biosynthesis
VRRSPVRERPLLVHLTTVDLSLAYLLLPQLTAFRDAGYDVVGVSAPGEHVATLAEHGIGHVPLTRSTRAPTCGPTSPPPASSPDLPAAAPDIVHTHNPKPGVYGRILARLAGVPAVVNTVHGLYALPSDPWPKRAVVYTLERLAAAFSHAELLQNPEDLPTLRRLQSRRPSCTCSATGWTSKVRPGPPRRRARRSERPWASRDDEVVVGLVGRLVAEKGYREVFAAAERLRARHPQARLVVAGPADPDKADAISQAELDRAAERAGVRFLGMHTEVERLYPAFDLYVLASHREGFPRSAMEAAAMGLPLVLTDIRGCRQVVDHDVTGVLVPVRDPGRLAEAIGTLVADPDRRARMSAAARAKALAEFDDRRQVQITLDVYRSLLERP